MMIKLKYHGVVSEIIGTEVEVLEVDSNSSVDSLCNMLNERWSKLSTVQYKVAVNHSISNTNSILEDEDEVAILPPFSGG
ncbi:MAG: MoaD/ThiS family protein [Deltaproteobacteria bacterium]|jgi:sulfur-carrier protein|nr:MoaD/ThiS family protein [Flavobacteriales bacterium]MBT6492854.1 MoaD/ThiS family protein [Deltaproteobacteria bacterium]